MCGFNVPCSKFIDDALVAFPHKGGTRVRLRGRTRKKRVKTFNEIRASPNGSWPAWSEADKKIFYFSNDWSVPLGLASVSVYNYITSIFIANGSGISKSHNLLDKKCFNTKPPVNNVPFLRKMQILKRGWWAGRPFWNGTSWFNEELSMTSAEYKCNIVWVSSLFGVVQLSELEWPSRVCRRAITLEYVRHQARWKWFRMVRSKYVY